MAITILPQKPKSLLLLFAFVFMINNGFTGVSVFNVLDYGTDNTGRTPATHGIQAAIDECAAKGGGTVYLPAGKYLSGTLYLKSFVTLYLDAGSVIQGSTNIGDYPVTMSKIRSYTDNYTNKSLIYGEDLEHTGIEGNGTIDGNGSDFSIPQESARKDPSASYKARPYIIRMINCSNVLIRDINILNSPMWVQHYLLCSDVEIRGISVNSRVNSNNDGIDIDACTNVRISDCNIVSGDDAIVLKSTLDRPCRNITVTNCVLSSDCNAFKLGTESNGGFHNITFSNSIIYDTKLAGIALEMVDGGTLENITVTAINMDNVDCPVFIRLADRARPFRENMEKPGMGKLSGIIISHIQGINIGSTGCSVTGLPSFPVRDISLSDIRISFRGGNKEDLSRKPVEELPDKYPESKMFGTLPAYGFYCRHVYNLEMNNIYLSCRIPDNRPSIILTDAACSSVSRLKEKSGEDTGSAIIIDNSQDIIISECSQINENKTLASIINGSTNIRFINNSLPAKTGSFRTDSTVNGSDIIVR